MRETEQIITGIGIAVIAALLLFGCATQPPLAQLAQRCDEMATAVNVAAVHRAQGKLSAAQVDAVLATEPIAKALCDKTNPPTDVQGALSRVVAQAERITLINAGVK